MIPRSLRRFYFFITETMLSQVYEEISNHFSETRHKRWPNVTKFLESLEEGTLLLDVGCGNGKYLCRDRNVYKVFYYLNYFKYLVNRTTDKIEIY